MTSKTVTSGSVAPSPSADAPSDSPSALGRAISSPVSASGLECRNVELKRHHSAGEMQHVLIDVCASFPRATCTLIFGATGSGKSTLLELLAGLLRPTAGEIVANGESISRYTAEHRDRWRRSVGICFQRPELRADLTALENVLLPLIPRGLGLDELRTRASQGLSRVDMQASAGRRAGALSLGQRQRVALARALVVRPQYLLVDEPTAHQDESGTRRIIEILEQQAAAGGTVVATSHDPRLQCQDIFASRFRLLDGRLLPESPGASPRESIDARCEPTQ